jgi:uncharacterized Zn finger protein
MALEPCQQETVLNWLQERELPRQCPSCGSEKEFIGCDVVELHVKSDREGISGTEIPVVPLICQNCGHVRLFSAKLIGL